jgi:hypothetical protein
MELTKSSKHFLWPTLPPNIMHKAGAVRNWFHLNLTLNMLNCSCVRECVAVCMHSCACVYECLCAVVIAVVFVVIRLTSNWAVCVLNSNWALSCIRPMASILYVFPHLLSRKCTNEILITPLPQWDTCRIQSRDNSNTQHSCQQPRLCELRKTHTWSSNRTTHLFP